MDGKQYQVIGEADRVNRDEPLDLRSVSVRNADGNLITLNNLVITKTQSTSPQLYRYNRYIAATVSASPAQGVTLGQGIEAMDKIAAEVLDDSFSTALSGTSKDYNESSGSLYFAFGLALVLIYLVLAAQFESFIDPLIIMFTVLCWQLQELCSRCGCSVIPSTSSARLVSLYFIGIVTKNGILIVEFANQRKEEGLSKLDAVMEAATLRLRPILMTSLATILGALPIALALGAASTSRIPMGVSIIGGLIFSLILTLVIIPVIYSYMSRDIKGTRKPGIAVNKNLQ